jgi:hypothetical protein
MSTKYLYFFIVSFIAGCIGIDAVDDPILGPPAILVNKTSVVLMPSDTEQLEAQYIDEYGIERNVEFMWLSSNSDVAEVSTTGLITAKSAGQVIVQAVFKEVISMQVNVNIVIDENAVATVSIQAPKNILNPNESIQLQVAVRNINGETLEGRQVEWFSENSSIASVSQAGEVTAVSGGVVDIHAKSEGVKSNIITFTITGARTGTFVPSGGYQARGTATLALESGQLILRLSNDFQTSFALGTYIYLSNTTNASGTLSNGKELAQISTNGAHTFNVTQKFPNIGLYDYRYVIILCKPAVVTFGYADLN